MDNNIISGLDRLSSDYNRGYTKAIQDMQEAFEYIEHDLAHHKKRLNGKLAKELLACFLTNREKVRENRNGFIRWNCVRKELLQQYPSWNESRHDIVKAFYGDIPVIIYNQERYEDYCKLEDNTLKNIECASAYVYSQNGTYFDYRTLIGNVYIGEDRKVLHGDITVKHQGKSYHIILNKMYGFNALTILRLSSTGVTGWCNKDGQGSPSSQRYTKEINTETVEHILKDGLNDYGESIQKLMETVRKTYSEDTNNYIMSKCFNL